MQQNLQKCLNFLASLIFDNNFSRTILSENNLYLYSACTHWLRTSKLNMNLENFLDISKVMLSHMGSSKVILNRHELQIECTNNTDYRYLWTFTSISIYLSMPFCDKCYSEEQKRKFSINIYEKLFEIYIYRYVYIIIFCFS